MTTLPVDARLHLEVAGEATLGSDEIRALCRAVIAIRGLLSDTRRRQQNTGRPDEAFIYGKQADALAAILADAPARARRG